MANIITATDVNFVNVDSQEIDERGHVFRCADLGDIDRLIENESYQGELQRLVENTVKDIASGKIDSASARVRDFLGLDGEREPGSADAA